MEQSEILFLEISSTQIIFEIFSLILASKFLVRSVLLLNKKTQQ